MFVTRFVGAAAFALVATMAVAQSNNMSKMSCSLLGSPAPEALPDGQGLQELAFACRVESGPLAGGTLSGTQMWQFKGPNGTFLAGHGVVRTGQGVVVYRNTEGTTVVKMVDGKPAGSSGSGKGVYPAAFGASAVTALAGKNYSWKSETTGVNQFTIEVNHE